MNYELTAAQMKGLREIDPWELEEYRKQCEQALAAAELRHCEEVERVVTDWLLETHEADIIAAAYTITQNNLYAVYNWLTGRSTDGLRPKPEAHDGQLYIRWAPDSTVTSQPADDLSWL